MTHRNQRNRTSTSLSLAALLIAMGIEIGMSEAQQAVETPDAAPADPTATTGGAGAGGQGVPGGSGGPVLTDPNPQTYTYVGPPGSGYVFMQPPPADYVMLDPGNPNCGAGTGIPNCVGAAKICCPSPNGTEMICCIPTTGAQ